MVSSPGRSCASPTASQPTTREFYTLPKLHKVDPASPTTPPGRPIVSDTRSANIAASKLIEYFRNPRHLVDSYHLIAKLKSIVLAESAILCTMDVSSLYTNIPIEEGVERVRHAFARHPDPTRPDQVLIDLLHHTLRHNDFVFDDKHWLQTSSVAMGKAFEGSFTNLYMGEWEESALSTSALKPEVWLRYQDDIFMIWNNCRDNLDSFVAHLNAQDRNIQVTSHYDFNSVRFLDLEVFRSPSGRRGYRVAFKSTDGHLLLPNDSHHPSHTHRGVLFGQILRWATHTSTRADLHSACKEVFLVWRRQGITRSTLRSAVQRVFSTTGKAAQWSTGFFRCGSQRCKACPFAQERQMLSSATPAGIDSSL